MRLRKNREIWQYMSLGRPGEWFGAAGVNKSLDDRLDIVTFYVRHGSSRALVICMQAWQRESGIAIRDRPL